MYVKSQHVLTRIKSEKEESDAELDERYEPCYFNVVTSTRFEKFFLHWNGAEKDESWKKLLVATDAGTITHYESPQKSRPSWIKVCG